MATLKELFEAAATIKESIVLYGITKKAAMQFPELERAAGRAVMEEQGITDPQKAIALPMETKLGRKSRAVLKELQAFFEKKGAAVTKQ